MSATVVVVVARGHTVRADGEDHGPGTELRFSPSEAQDLIERGFVHKPGEAPIIRRVTAMEAAPREGMTKVGRVSAHHALAADRGRFFTR